jgi:hypothetical protein
MIIVPAPNRTETMLVNVDFVLKHADWNLTGYDRASRQNSQPRRGLEGPQQRTDYRRSAQIVSYQPAATNHGSYGFDEFDGIYGNDASRAR